MKLQKLQERNWTTNVRTGNEGKTEVNTKSESILLQEEMMGSFSENEIDFGSTHINQTEPKETTIGSYHFSNEMQLELMRTVQELKEDMATVKKNLFGDGQDMKLLKDLLKNRLEVQKDSSLKNKEICNVI